MDGKPLVTQFSEDLASVINKYEKSEMTMAEIIGVLEMLKHEIISDTLFEYEEKEDF